MMNKMLIILAIISLLSLSFVSDSNATDSAFKWGRITSETLDLLGSPISNPAGEMLGIVNAFANDSEGHITFLILWEGVPEGANGGRYLAVPFRALSVSENEPTQMTVVLNIDKMTLNSAPSLDKSKDLNNSEWTAGIYRHFVQVPYWTEEEAGKEVQQQQIHRKAATIIPIE